MSGPGSPRPVRKRRRKVVINLSNCRYPVIEEAALALSWVVTRDDKAEWDLYWTDTSVSEERVLKLKKAQRINHFAGMQTLARKTSMARLLRRVGSHLPSAFAFMPQTWVLPNEGSNLKKQIKSNPRWFIVKPDGSCQGKGIFLTNCAETVCAFSPAAVAQEYVDDPFLIDNLKFDIRIYVLVTSCDPLRVYLYKEGLARFCTKNYNAPSEENAQETMMHLTNYAINKKQDNFKCSDDGTTGFKRTLTSVWQWLDEHGHSSQTVIDSISRLSVSTLLAAQPSLVNTARNLNITSRDDRGLASFELLGLDVMLDKNLKPWLIEVNHSPSFACESDIDQKIKSKLLIDTLSILHVSTRHSRWLKVKDKSEAAMRLNGAPPRRAPADEGEKIRSLRMRHEERNLGGFTRIYPAPLGSTDADLYQEVEQAARRAHEEGEAKPAVEVKPLQTPTDALRPGGGSDWRARANLFCRSSSSTSPPPSPLLTTSVSASSGHHPFKYSGLGARRHGHDTVSLSLTIGAANWHRSRDSSATSNRDAEYLDAAPPSLPQHRLSDRLGIGVGGAAELAGLRSRLKSGGSSRAAAWGVGGSGEEGGGLTLPKKNGLGSYGSYQSLFSGEGWADGVPVVSHKVKLRRVYGW